MAALTQIADKILVPVLPSDIDTHACSRCVQNLLLVAEGYAAAKIASESSPIAYAAIP